MSLGGAYTAVAEDGTAFYWNPAGLAFGPFLRASVVTGRSEMDRGRFLASLDSGTLDQAADPTLAVDNATSFGIGFTFLGVAATSRSQAFVRPVQGQANEPSLISERLDTFDFSVSVVQSLPLDNLVVATNLHYLRGTSFVREDPSGLSSADQDARSLRERAGIAESREDSGFALDVGAMYEPVNGLRFGLMLRDVVAPTFRLPSDAELPSETHARAGALLTLPRGRRVMVDLDLTTHSHRRGLAGEAPSDEWREVALGAEQELADGKLVARGGLRVEAGGERGSRASFSLGAGVTLPWVIVDVAALLSESGRDRGFFVSATVSR